MRPDAEGQFRKIGGPVDIVECANTIMGGDFLRRAGHYCQVVQCSGGEWRLLRKGLFWKGKRGEKGTKYLARP